MHIWWKKNEIGCTVFTLISINYCFRSVTTIVLTTIFDFYFSILFRQCKCIHVRLLWSKFYWTIPSAFFFFSNFGYMTVSAKQKFVFDSHFETIYFCLLVFVCLVFFFVLFCFVCLPVCFLFCFVLFCFVFSLFTIVLGVYRHGAISYRNSYGKVLR